MSERRWRTMEARAFNGGVAGLSVALVGALVAASAGACGGGDPPSVQKTMTEACVEARDIFAAAPEPVDPASQTAFFDASDRAVRAATFPARDLTEEVDNRGLEGLEFQLDHFPRPVSSGDPVPVAFEARAAIVRLDRFAGDIGVPGCGAATWRPEAWASLTDRASDRPTEAAFAANMRTVCAETFGGVPAGGDRVEDLVAGQAATAAVTEFKRRLLEMPPPRSMEDEYIALVAALLEFDAAVPDVAPTDPPPDLQERSDAAQADVLKALEAMRVAGGVPEGEAWC